MDLNTFRGIFRGLTAVFPSRGLSAGTLEAYYGVLGHLPADVLTRSARHLATTAKFFPSAKEWSDAVASTPRGYPADGSRRLDELDNLAPNDHERDEVCKGLSLDDQRALMARYGESWR